MIKFYVSLFLSVILYCSGGTTDVAGTISETDTGCSIAGIVSDDNGNIVHDAVVVIHNLRNINSTSLSKHQTTNAWPLADTTVTDEHGLFLFDSVDTGNFLIEVLNSDSLSAITPITVQHADSFIQTQSIVKPNGAIFGRIDTSIDGSTGKIAVLIRELGRIFQIDYSETFSIGNVPEWNYHLSLVCDTLVDTSAGATALVPVSSGSTSRVIGLGSPTGLTVEQDSVMYANISVNTDSGNGGGIAFLGSDSILKLQLMIGQKNFYHQVIVNINKYKTDSLGTLAHNVIPILTVNNADLSVLNNGSLLSKFNIVENYSYLAFKVSADTSRISGTIVIAGIPENPLYTPVNITGSFTVDVGPGGEESWDCDFGDTICSCWFIYR
jgi:hypothetical protein